MIMRHEDWVRRLSDAVSMHVRLPGEWGVSDCWMCTMDAHDAVTGERLLPDLRGYDSEKAGYRLFAGHGFRTVTEALASALEPVAPLAAMRGDIAIVDGPNGPSCGPVTASGIAIKTLYDDGRAAMRWLALDEAVAVFKVGR